MINENLHSVESLVATTNGHGGHFSSFYLKTGRLGCQLFLCNRTCTAWLLVCKVKPGMTLAHIGEKSHVESVLVMPHLAQLFHSASFCRGPRHRNPTLPLDPIVMHLALKNAPLTLWDLDVLSHPPSPRWSLLSFDWIRFGCRSDAGTSLFPHILRAYPERSLVKGLKVYPLCFLTLKLHGFIWGSWVVILGCRESNQLIKMVLWKGIVNVSALRWEALLMFTLMHQVCTPTDALYDVSVGGLTPFWSHCFHQNHPVIDWLIDKPLILSFHPFHFSIVLGTWPFNQSHQLSVQINQVVFSAENLISWALLTAIWSAFCQCVTYFQLSKGPQSWSILLGSSWNWIRTSDWISPMFSRGLHS